MANTILEIKNVSKYFGKKKIIDGISLEVKEGEIYGFLGPNGAGKTTTIKMALGLLSIDEGNILINGFDVKKQFESAMQYIGGIVENPDMYGYMSGWDNLKLYARIRNVSKKRMEEVVELVGLTERIYDKVSKYSLGMKQRLGLCLTLLHSPKVLILDEPTNGLDPAGIRQLRDILKKISHQEKVAVFISSHLLSEMELMCDKVAVVDKGKLLKIETIQEALQETNTDEKLLYMLEVEPIEKALSVLNTKGYEVAIIEDLLHLQIQREQIPNVIKELVENDIAIYRVMTKSHSLEDAFLTMTEGGASHA